MIVEDEAEMREELAALVSGDDRAVLQAENGKEALEIIAGTNVDLIVSDIRMPDIDGLELLRAVRASYPETLFIMITAFASTKTAVAALRGGAYDYIMKPFSLDEVRSSVDHALENRRLFQEVNYLRGCLQDRYSFENIIGKSPPMQRVFDLITQLAPTPCNVLITGESGTGKELVAQAIHYQSPRAKGRFVPLNCAALPESLLESELFGHVKGAFTGAGFEKVGLIQVADCGTLFLDEIGDMSEPVQIRLLRVIQNREVQKVGSTNLEKVDVRIIAATHRDLKKKVRDGSFREDLYYRINVVEVDLPPLRDRVEDIALLAAHFLKKYAERSGKRIPGIVPEVHRAFRIYSWPGNVRELEHAIERAVILCTGDTITVADLPPAIAGFSPELLTKKSSLDHLTVQFERYCIERAFEEEEGDPRRAARSLGISLSTLYRKVRKHRISLPKPSPPTR